METSPFKSTHMLFISVIIECQMFYFVQVEELVDTRFVQFLTIPCDCLIPIAPEIENQKESEISSTATVKFSNLSPICKSVTIFSSKGNSNHPSNPNGHFSSSCPVSHLSE